MGMVEQSAILRCKSQLVSSLEVALLIFLIIFLSDKLLCLCWTRKNGYDYYVFVSISIRQSLFVLWFSRHCIFIILPALYLMHFAFYPILFDRDNTDFGSTSWLLRYRIFICMFIHSLKPELQYQLLDKFIHMYQLQVNLKRSREDGEKCYNQLSNEERAKFDNETLVKLNSKDKTSSRNQSYDRFSNEYTKVW